MALRSALDVIGFIVIVNVVDEFESFSRAEYDSRLHAQSSELVKQSEAFSNKVYAELERIERLVYHQTDHSVFGRSSTQLQQQGSSSSWWGTSAPARTLKGTGSSRVINNRDIEEFLTGFYNLNESPTTTYPNHGVYVFGQQLLGKVSNMNGNQSDISVCGGAAPSIPVHDTGALMAQLGSNETSATHKLLTLLGEREARISQIDELARKGDDKFARQMALKAGDIVSPEEAETDWRDRVLIKVVGCGILSYALNVMLPSAPPVIDAATEVAAASSNRILSRMNLSADNIRQRLPKLGIVARWPLALMVGGFIAYQITGEYATKCLLSKNKSDVEPSRKNPSSSSAAASSTGATNSFSILDFLQVNISWLSDEGSEDGLQDGDLMNGKIGIPPVWPGATRFNPYTSHRLVLDLMGRPYAEEVLYRHLLYIRLCGLCGPIPSILASGLIYATMQDPVADVRHAVRGSTYGDAMTDTAIFGVAQQFLYYITGGRLLAPMLVNILSNVEAVFLEALMDERIWHLRRAYCDKVNELAMLRTPYDALPVLASIRARLIPDVPSVTTQSGQPSAEVKKLALAAIANAPLLSLSSKSKVPQGSVSLEQAIGILMALEFSLHLQSAVSSDATINAGHVQSLPIKDVLGPVAARLVGSVLFLSTLKEVLGKETLIHDTTIAKNMFELITDIYFSYRSCQHLHGMRSRYPQRSSITPAELETEIVLTLLQFKNLLGNDVSINFSNLQKDLQYWQLADREMLLDVIDHYYQGRLKSIEHDCDHVLLEPKLKRSALTLDQLVKSPAVNRFEDPAQYQSVMRWVTTVSDWQRGSFKLAKFGLVPTSFHAITQNRARSDPDVAQLVRSWHDYFLSDTFAKKNIYCHVYRDHYKAAVDAKR
jgi:hypothetical protein